MLAHVHMHVRGIEVIIGKLMVPTFYFTNEKKFWRQLRYILRSPWLQTMIHRLFVSESLLFTSVNVKPMESSLGVKKNNSTSHMCSSISFSEWQKEQPYNERKKVAQFSSSICV